MQPHADDSQTYRLIGIRSDRSREVIGEGLSQERASELFLLHMDLKDFKALVVEDE